MNLYLRMIKVMVSAWFGRPLEPLDTSIVTMRVWPNDLDLNMHMNNGRFLTLMDLGRGDLITRGGFLRIALKRGWFPVVGAQIISFYRPLNAFQKFDLKTKIVGWDDDWIFLEQEFWRNGRGHEYR